METEATQECSRCKRSRRVQFMVLRTSYAGKRVWRCRKKSVCASKARRLREAQALKTQASKTKGK
jgi:hypothetical protein